MKFLTLASSALCLSTSAASLTENGLQAYWNAATTEGMDTVGAQDQADLDGDGTYEKYAVTYVNGWTSMGECSVTLGSTTNDLGRPYYFTNAFTRADGSHAAAVRMNWRPYTEAWTASWRFQQLMTDPGVKVNFNLDKEMTWFFVANLKQNFQNQGGALWGFTTGEPGAETPARIGIFSPGIDGKALRVYTMNNGVGAAGNVSTPDFGTPFLMDARMSAKTMTVGLDGVAAIAPAVNQTVYAANPARFEIGANHDMMNPTYRPSMDIGALVIYNRALNDAERVIVRETLAAEFGISLGAASIYAGGKEANGFWLYDLVGVGSSTDATGGAVPGVATVSGWSGEALQLSIVSGVNGNGDYLFAARQVKKEAEWTYDADLGGYRLADVWRLERHGNTLGKVRISYRASNTDFRGALVIKPAASSAYVPMAAEATYDEQTGVMSFVVDDDVLKTGTLVSVLRLAGGRASVTEPTVSFRADTGITADVNGVISKWANQGSLGADLDVSSYLGSVSRVVGGIARADGSTHDVVRFPGQAYLRATTQSVLGIAGEVSWFVMMKPSVVGGTYGHTVFGLEPWNGRFGAFIPSGANQSMTCYPGASTVSLSLSPLAADTWTLADIRHKTGTDIQGGLNDGQSSSAACALPPAPQAQYFVIGNAFGIEDWIKQYNPPFIGDMAEVRVYNRRLNDIERLRVRQEMMCYCGFAPDSNSRFASTAAGAQGYEKDLAVVGSLSDGAAAEVREDCSGGLDVTATASSGIAVGNTLVFAHNGLEGWSGSGSDVNDGFVTNRLARVWRVVPSGNAGIAARLSFPVEDLVGRDRRRNKWRLLYRDIAAAKFDVLATEATVSAGVVSFSLPAKSVASGLYTVGLQRDDKGSILVVR